MTGASTRQNGNRPPRAAGFPSFCVCVPARNEADRLPILLGALSAHDRPEPITVLVSVNNTNDGSRQVLLDAAHHYRESLLLRIDETVFPPAAAHAGSARRRAMDLGLALLRGQGILLTTDADTRPPPEWIGENLAAIARGADMVGGSLILDDREALPDAAAALKARWDAYWSTVREIEDDLDPRPEDAAPRHGDHTGASLAITAQLYRKIGGAPLLPTGEDRALVRAGLGAGGRLAHPPAVWTRVSPRRDGRAASGMADDMASLMAQAARGETAFAPNFSHWRERAAWRRRVRSEVGVLEMLRREDALPSMPMDMALPEARA